MTPPRIEIRFVESSSAGSDGYLLVIVNGFSQPTIRVKHFDLGNDANLHMSLHALIEKVYEKGFVDGEREGRKRVTDLIKWAAE